VLDAGALDDVDNEHEHDECLKGSNLGRLPILLQPLLTVCANHVVGRFPFILRFNSSQAKEARQQCATELLVSRVSEATEVTIQLTLL
jgi:hypothetical protein